MQCMLLCPFSELNILVHCADFHCVLCNALKPYMSPTVVYSIASVKYIKHSEVIVLSTEPIQANILIYSALVGIRNKEAGRRS